MFRPQYFPESRMCVNRTPTRGLCLSYLPGKRMRYSSARSSSLPQRKRTLGVAGARTRLRGRRAKLPPSGGGGVRGSLQEWSAVLHLHLDNKHDRVSANHFLLRIRLCLWVTPVDRGPDMCASPLLSRKTPVSPKLQLFVGRFSAMAISLWARTLRGCGAAAAQSASFCPKCQT